MKIQNAQTQAYLAIIFAALVFKAIDLRMYLIYLGFIVLNFTIAKFLVGVKDAANAAKLLQRKRYADQMAMSPNPLVRGQK